MVMKCYLKENFIFDKEYISPIAWEILCCGVLLWYNMWCESVTNIKLMDLPVVTIDGRNILSGIGVNFCVSSGKYWRGYYHC